jgi:hypothetical protein
MARESIFNPDGPQTEHSGSRYLGPRADNLSHMPPDVTDGEVSPQEAADLEKLANAADEPPEQRLEDLADGKANPDAEQ